MRVICHVMHCAQSFESSCIAMVQTDYLSLVLILIYVYYVQFFLFFFIMFLWRWTGWLPRFCLFWSHPPRLNASSDHFRLFQGTIRNRKKGIEAPRFTKMVILLMPPFSLSYEKWKFSCWNRCSNQTRLLHHTQWRKRFRNRIDGNSTCVIMHSKFELDFLINHTELLETQSLRRLGCSMEPFFHVDVVIH